MNTEARVVVVERHDILVESVLRSLVSSAPVLSDLIRLYNATRLLADEDLGKTVPVDKHTNINMVNLATALPEINEQTSHVKNINDIHRPSFKVFQPILGRYLTTEHF